MNLYQKELPITADERRKLGEAIQFFRMVKFENGLIVDGEMSIRKMVVPLAKVMMANPQLAEMIMHAATLYKTVENMPGGSNFLSLIEAWFENMECTCPSCTEQRAQLKKKQTEN